MQPKVVIENEVYRKIMHWVNKSSYEVSGLGTVVWDAKESSFRVISALLLPQKNTHTHTDIKPEDVCKAMYNLRDAPGELKFWWHSHVNMGVFWSGEDMSTIRDFGSGGWVLASVFNKKNEVRSAFYGVGGLLPTWIDQIPTSVVEFQDPKAAEWDAEYQLNVTNQVFTPPAQIWTPNAGWVKSQAGSVTETTTTATGGTKKGTATDIAESTLEFMQLNEPPKERPPNMTKRDYKRWKKVWRDQEQQELELAREGKLDTGNGSLVKTYECFATGRIVTEDSFDQAYPFTKAELNLFSRLGFDNSELDYMIGQQGWTRGDILRAVSSLMDHSKTPIEVESELEENLEDIPVADRGRML